MQFRILLVNREIEKTIKIPFMLPIYEWVSFRRKEFIRNIYSSMDEVLFLLEFFSNAF